MPRFSARPELLVPVSPLQAYAADVERLGGLSPIGAADDVWLVAAHALSRAAALTLGERAALVAAAADAMEQVAADGAQLAGPVARDAAERAVRTTAAAAGALRTISHLLDGQPTADFDAALGAAIDALREMVAEQEQAGAFTLAYTTLTALRQTIAPMLDAHSAGLLLTQQGRAARQLGALETARELYEAAVREARAAGSAGVAGRALVGLGTLAAMRGNYPDAREAFRQGVAAARQADAPDLECAAHQGLLVAAIAAGDAETALAHGWAAVQRTSPDTPDARAEALVNLAEAGRLAGEHRAALGAVLGALELSDLTRIRLPALGTAVREAAALGESRLVSHLAQEIDRLVDRCGLPFETARTLVELAEALADVGDARATAYAERAAELARVGGFHEVALRAELAAEGVRARDDHSRREEESRGGAEAGHRVRSPRVRAVVRSMEALPTKGRWLAGAI